MKMELRKDYLLDKWVIISEKRSKRPIQFKKEEDSIKQKEKIDKNCFFCAGNEHLTPSEIGSIKQNNHWIMRWFDNKFPAVEKKGKTNIETHNDFYTFSNAYGAHIVIVETPYHNKQLADLSKKDIAKLFNVYSILINNLEKDPNTKFVNVFKNKGKEAGASIQHSHSQIISLNKIPPKISYLLSSISIHIKQQVTVHGYFYSIGQRTQDQIPVS